MNMIDTILPKIRDDISYKILNQKPREIILFDPKGYTNVELQLPIEIVPVLQLLNGNLGLQQLENILQSQFGKDYDVEPLYNLFKYLDHLGFMDTLRFRTLKEELNSYLESLVRPPICAGGTYSSNPIELAAQLNNLMSKYDSNKVKKGAKAIIVPHIDFRIGDDALASYAAPYHSIKESDADLFVIFGTAHHGNSDDFMFSAKDFQTPLGDVKTDRKLLDEIKTSADFEITIDEMARKDEHSIELQTVLLKHFFKERDFRILPILSGSFYNYIIDKSNPSENLRYMKIIKAIKQSISKLNRNPIFIASGDLAHIGRKFGDNFDAEPELNRLRDEDQQLIKALEKNKPEKFFEEISRMDDKNKICGLSPFYSLLKIIEPKKAIFYKYGQWNEIEQASAVSFTGISFY